MITRSRTAQIIAVLTGLGLFVASCGGGGDTDGGASTGDQGNGNPIVSNGGFGSKMTIELENDDGIEIPTAGQAKFLVKATDPNGQPLTFIRIFCESERGLAILEPSSGGVAFENTNSRGAFSGVLGGVSPGSFLLECRAPQGFNLVARKHFKVVGDVPEGFDGFPGAAGGNLGGGVIVDPPAGEDVTVTQVTFTDITGDQGRVANIDNNFNTNCDNDPATIGPIEPFGPDNYSLAVNNQLDQRVFVQSIKFEVFSGSTLVATSVDQLGGLVIASNTSTNLVGVFTDSQGPSGKVFAGTSVPTATGTYNVIFTVNMTTSDGTEIEVEQAASIIIGGYNNC